MPAIGSPPICRIRMLEVYCSFESLVWIMLESLLNFVGCRHRRLTRPITPVSKPGVPSGETYVVCLDCGKQFSYDWDAMRMGKQIPQASTAGVLQPDTPKSRNGLKYFAVGMAVPISVMIGKAFRSKRREREDARRDGAPQ